MKQARRGGKIEALPGSGSAERKIGAEEELSDATQVFDAAGAAEAREAEAAVPRLLPESGPSGAPSKVGRYVVLDVLGMGGMGVVCTAYDPKLDRKVALKLLRRKIGRSGRSSTGRARLVREAQSLAKLSHPNIVTVHDVDTTPDGRIYMAMEFVRGKTITQWITTAKPDWRQILAMFEKAAIGLAAAHAADITHRDFKPANVLIGEDGRVKVLDFGLAKSQSVNLSSDSDDNRTEQAGAAEDIMQVVQSTGDMKLTMAGRIVGTPAYMSPEQRRGKPTGPSTDQFSFAVTLYEALYGKLPYRSESHSRDAAKGRVIDPPSDTEVPAWVFRALRRALEPDPLRRYPSMQGFIAALRADPAKRRRKIFMWSGGALTLGSAIGFAALAYPGEDEICKGARARLDSAWSPQRRDVVDAALRGTGTAYAAYTADRVLETIDGYAEGWVEARTTVCEATWVHGEQSEATLDVRMRCLDQRQGELRALVDVLSDADADVVEQAVSAVAALTPAQSCVTAEPGAANRLPDDPKLRAAVLEAQSKTDDAEALMRAGRYQVAREVAAEASRLAAQTKHVPTIARAVFIDGLVAQKLGDYAVASERFEASTQTAARAGDAVLETQALVSMVRVAGVHMHEFDRARGISVAAESALIRAGTPSELESRLALQLGTSALAARETDEAVDKLREALAAAEQAYPPEDVRFADLLVNLGVALAQRGDLVEAEALLRRALGLREANQGPMHPAVATVAQNLANVVGSKPSGLEEAIDHINRSMKIRRAVLGPDAKIVANLWMTKARLHHKAEQLELALSEYETAAKIYRKVGSNVELGEALVNLSNLHIEREEFDAALSTATEAVGRFKGQSKREKRGRALAALRVCVARRRAGREKATAVDACLEAIRQLDATGVQGVEHNRALEELALAYEQAGEYALALEAAKRCLASAPNAARREASNELISRLERTRR